MPPKGPANATDIETFLKHCPQSPGVYRFWDARGKLLYVGKAKQLKSRVSSYFQQSKDKAPRTQTMVSHIAKIDTIITQTEVEALILEATLVQELHPKYNILLRDDKRYPWLALTAEPFPRLIVVRKPSKRFKHCFGPYPSASAMHQSLKLIRTLFPLRQRSRPLFKDRPCMNFHIGQCLAPCVQGVSAEDYEVMVKQLTLFLRGHAQDVLKTLNQHMMDAAEAMSFEKAALLRDRIKAIETVIQQQRIMVPDTTVHMDVVGLAHDASQASLCILKIRAGKLVQTHYFAESLPPGSTEPEALSSFIEQHYAQVGEDDLPPILLLPYDLPDADVVQAWLSQRYQAVHKKGAFELMTPSSLKQNRKTYQSDMLTMAAANAQDALNHTQQEQQARLERDPAKALHELSERLKLSEPPHRMECFDISHVGGTNTVASMVVFTQGRPDKSQYRRFIIKSTDDGTPNDFQSMAEVIERRFSPKNIEKWGLPDLLVIDGGKGQLSSALESLEAQGHRGQAVISLAKKFEEIYFPHQTRPLVLERDSEALFLLQRLRDEAHRFAITFHREKRQKAQTHSVLDDLPGVGPKRKALLQKAFPTQKALTSASVDDVAKALNLGEKTAQAIVEAIQAATKNAQR